MNAVSHEHLGIIDERAVHARELLPCLPAQVRLEARDEQRLLEGREHIGHRRAADGRAQGQASPTYELRAGALSVLERLEQRLLDVQKLVVRYLALVVKLAVAGKEDKEVGGGVDVCEHRLCIPRLIQVILVGDGHQGRRAVVDRTVPIMHDTRLALVNVELDPVLLGSRSDVIIGC